MKIEEAIKGAVGVVVLEAAIGFVAGAIFADAVSWAFLGACAGVIMVIVAGLFGLLSDL